MATLDYNFFLYAAAPSTYASIIICIEHFQTVSHVGTVEHLMSHTYAKKDTYHYIYANSYPIGVSTRLWLHRAIITPTVSQRLVAVGSYGQDFL